MPNDERDFARVVEQPSAEHGDLPRPTTSTSATTLPETDHVHDCTGADRRCPCGFVLRIPPVCVSIEVTEGLSTVFIEGFNCDTIGGAIDGLQAAIARLRTYRPD